VASSVGPPVTAGAEAEPEAELEAGVEAEAEPEADAEPELDPEPDPEPDPELAELEELSKFRTLPPSSLPQLEVTSAKTVRIGINKSAILDLTTSP
jgi:hypothetical protein